MERQAFELLLRHHVSTYLQSAPTETASAALTRELSYLVAQLAESEGPPRALQICRELMPAVLAEVTRAREAMPTH